jgi:hypothetical protein
MMHKFSVHSYMNLAVTLGTNLECLLAQGGRNKPTI